MGKFVDILGQTFGRLTTIKRLENHHKSKKAMWLCVCTCGNESQVKSDQLRTGKTQSCGCLQRDRTGDAARTHGGSGTSEHRIWKLMRDRCKNVKSPSYPYYGGRGILVCDRWGDFKNFLEDVGPRPSAKHSIDRINNDGNYEPSNCRWATRKQQMRNTRANAMITSGGVTKSMAAWAEDLGVSYWAIRARRHRGWPTEETLHGRKAAT